MSRDSVRVDADADDDDDGSVDTDIEFEPIAATDDGLPFEEGPLELGLEADAGALPTDEVEWAAVDLADAAQMKELWSFLFLNYVEDADEEFRFDYSVECLGWALLPPGYKPDWHVALRARDGGALVGFVAGVPLRLRVRNAIVDVCEVNFLCVNHTHRKRRIAPTLLAELARRAHRPRFYSAGTVLPRVVSETQYFHRPLNYTKLHAIGFTALPFGSTVEQAAAEHALPEDTTTPRLREMRAADVPAATALWTQYSARFSTAPVLSEADIAHALLPPRAPGAEQVVWSYVVEDAQGAVCEFVSFYGLSTNVLKHTDDPETGNRVLEGAYLGYYASASAEEELGQRLRALVADALVLAHRAGFDVFNCLTVMDNCLFLFDPALKRAQFGPGTGILKWYLDDYRVRPLAGIHATVDATPGRGIGTFMI